MLLLWLKSSSDLRGLLLWHRFQFPIVYYAYCCLFLCASQGGRAIPPEEGIVPKPNGLVQLYIDFQHLNAISVFDTYPMPSVGALLDVIEAQFLSTIDLTKLYWQLSLSSWGQRENHLCNFKKTIPLSQHVLCITWGSHLLSEGNG